MSRAPSHVTRHFTLQASAGAGKTRRLIKEVFQLFSSIKDEQELPKVIVTTFTNKATQEMRERLMFKAIKQKNWILLPIICDSKHLIVSTLHSILFSFLKNQVNSPVLGSEIMNDRQVMQLSRYTLRSILSKEDQFYPLLKHFDFDQLRKSFLDMTQKSNSKKNEKLFYSLKETEQKWIYYIQSLIEKEDLLKDPILEPIHKNPLQLNEDTFNLIRKKHKSKKTFIKELEKLHGESRPNHKSTLVPLFELFEKLYQLFFKEWEMQKKRKKWIEIGDIEKLTLQSIENDPKTISSFSKDWHYWFIDEYQDISLVQEKIIQSLSKESKETWAVGDPQQSIYLFRGADPTVFQNRIKISHKQNELDEDQTNHRSNPFLIHFFNDLFPKKQFKTFALPKDKKDTNKNSVHFLLYEKELSCEQSVAYQINKWISEGVSPGKIGILVNKNEDVTQIGSFLKSLRWPVQMHSKKMLRKELADILYLLKFLIQPYDNLSLIRILRTPYFYISDDRIASLRADRSNCLWDQMQEFMPEHKVTQHLKKLIQKTKQIGISETLSFFFENSLPISLSYHLDNTQTQESLLWNLLTEIKILEKKPQFQISSFIEDKLQSVESYDSDLLSSDSVSTINPEFIQIMTVHQSKGLEFDYVILPYIDKQKIKPDNRNFIYNQKEGKFSFFIKEDHSDSNISSVETTQWKSSRKMRLESEGDRLFYVATTRSKKGISFIYSKEASDKLLDPKKEINPIAKESTLKDMQKYDSFKKEGGRYTWLNQFQYFYYISLYLKFFEKPERSVLSIPNFNPHYKVEVTTLNSISSDLKYTIDPSSQVQSPSVFSSLTQKKWVFDADTFSNLNTLKGSIEGLKMHNILYKMAIHPKKLDAILSVFDQEERKKYEEAIQYLVALKEPPFEQLIQQRKVEWEFYYKEEEYFKSGRIDLWGEEKNKIWVIDYKSASTEITKGVWKQLETYGQTLQKLFPKKDVYLCAIQPFEKKCTYQPMKSIHLTPK